MAEKVIFEYVAGAHDKEPPHIKVRIKARAPWPTGFIDGLCCGAAELHLWHDCGARSHGSSIGRKVLRRQLDAFERMYRELYEEDST